MLQKAYAPVDYVWFMLVAYILCARACQMLSRREMNKELIDFKYEKNSFSVTIHLMHLNNNISRSLRCSCCEQVQEWLRNKSQVSREKLRSTSPASGQQDGHLEGARQFPVSSVHKQGSVNAGSQVRARGGSALTCSTLATHLTKSVNAQQKAALTDNCKNHTGHICHV